MTTGATGQLGLALPVQGELSGTWGDTVNNGITQYTNIAIAGTLTLTGDGAVTLANTTGDASASNITSTLAGAGTVTAQFAIVKVSGTTTTKVVTGPSYSKTYVVDNASSFAVTFKASGQTGVSIAAAEKVTVVFNGTDYIKLAGTIANAAGSNTQIQFNNGGLFGASANLTWDGTTLSSTQINITGQGTLRLQDTTGGEYVGLRSPSALGASYTLTFPADDGTSGQALITDGSGGLSWSTAASGDVYGPASATANGIALFDGTTGKIIKDSAATDGLIYGLTVGRGAGGGGTNTAFGNGALASNSGDTSNTALGFYALNGNLSGSYNVAVGRNSLISNLSGSNNIAIGLQALNASTTGANNVAIGYQAVYLNNESSMTAVGYQALYTGSNASTAVGYQAGYANNSNFNTYIGYLAGTSDVSAGAAFNVFVGAEAGKFYGAASNNNNTAVGGGAMMGSTTVANNTGTNNAAFGASALRVLTSGLSNVAIGNLSLYSNTTASNNTAVGFQALYSNTTATENTAVGYQALYSQTTASTGQNIAFGLQAGYSTNGYYNTFIGYKSGLSSTGNQNTFIGHGAGASMTSGSNNTILGIYNGNQGGLDIRTASNYIVLSDGDGNPRGFFNDSGRFHINNTSTRSGVSIFYTAQDVLNVHSDQAAGNATSLIAGWHSATSSTAGTLALNITTNGNITNINNSYGAISDAKLKENIVDASPKLADIMQVKVRNYNLIGDKQKQIGVIAQELEQIFPGIVDESPDRDQDGNDLGTTTKSVKYSVFVPMLIKAMQELKADFDAYKASHP